MPFGTKRRERVTGLRQAIQWKKGFQSGLRTSWELTKVVFPIAFLVQVAQFTPLLPFISKAVAPFLSWFGLSGEAAIPLVLGNILNLYAAIGAIQALDLTVKQVFILAVMLSFSHNLLIESALCKRVGVATWAVVLVRVGLAIFSAWAIHLLVPGGGEKVSYAVTMAREAIPTTWWEMGQMALITAIRGVLQLVLIVIPLMMAIQALKDLKALDKLASWLAPLLKPFGIAEKGAIAMASGLMVGLFFGAGLIIQEAKEQQLSKRDVTLIMIFLAACHAVVEDTLIFVPLGIPVIWLLLIRLAAAVLLTWIVARVWAAVPSAERITMRKSS